MRRRNRNGAGCQCRDWRHLRHRTQRSAVIGGRGTRGNPPPSRPESASTTTLAHHLLQHRTTQYLRGRRARTTAPGLATRHALKRCSQERRRRLSPERAICEACLERFRPILMTTMAALLGAVPLAIAVGPGSELRRPLGIPIIGGLLVSQALTLYTTPVIYLLLDRLHQRLWGGRPSHPMPEHTVAEVA